MKADFEYKGYAGSAEVDVEGAALVGRILFITDIITYSSDSVDGLRREFEQAVDEYLDCCGEAGVAPEQPCKGSFNVRVGHELHREAALSARRNGVSLNEFVQRALEVAVRPKVREVPQSITVHFHQGTDDHFVAAASTASEEAQVVRRTH